MEANCGRFYETGSSFLQLILAIVTIVILIATTRVATYPRLRASASHKRSLVCRILLVLVVRLYDVCMHVCIGVNPGGRGATPLLPPDFGLGS